MATPVPPAAPTQELPPWLSASTTTITNAAGQPVATATTLVFEPLTYFGPSIPLGTLFTFGGSTSPASTLETSTTVTPPSSSSSSSSAAPSSSFSSTSSSQPTFSSSPSASPTPQGHALARGQLIGVIIASILVFIFLIGLAVCFYLWWSGRRARRNARFSMVTPIDQDYEIVPPGGVTPEGSPRASGEEVDPFLTRNAGNATGAQTQQATGRSVTVAVAAGSGHPPSADNSLSSSARSTNSAASGYGTLLQNPSLGVFAPPLEERRGNILSREELRRLDEESALPSDMRPIPSNRVQARESDLTPLMPPPRLIDAERSQSRLSVLDRKPSLGSQSSVPADTGEATLLTARRIRAEDLAPRSTQAAPVNSRAEGPSPGPNSRRDSGILRGLGSLTGLGRFSWFQNMGNGSGSRRNSRAPIWLAAGFPDRDAEAGTALLDSHTGSPPPEMSETPGPRFRGQLGLGVGFGGERPNSGVSANSRTSTIYHDAQSSLPGTPVVMPPPRALANSSSAELGYWPQYGGAETASSTTAAQAQSQDERMGTQSTSGDIDVLDTPAPRAFSSFPSSASVRDAGTTSSSGSQTKALIPYPPGLTPLPTPGVWQDTAGTTPSPGSFAAVSLAHSTRTHRQSVGEADITIDVLEEDPPIPNSGWRSLAGSGTASEGRRTTFGQPRFTILPDLNSEQGSLHSMRSHLSPASTRSTGSAAASRRELSGSTGSASSRPSARSKAHSARSAVSGSDGGGSSLVHSASISSDERRRGRGPTLSPALSVFGPGSPPTSTIGHSSSPVASPMSEEFGEKSVRVVVPTPLPAVTVGGPTSSADAEQRPTSARPLSPLPFSTVPWVAGLDDAWAPS